MRLNQRRGLMSPAVRPSVSLGVAGALALQMLCAGMASADPRVIPRRACPPPPRCDLERAFEAGREWERRNLTDVLERCNQPHGEADLMFDDQDHGRAERYEACLRKIRWVAYGDNLAHLRAIISQCTAGLP